MLSLVIATLFASARAGALEFSLVGPSTIAVEYGDAFTIGIVMTNTSGLEVHSVGASVYAYGENEFVSGQAVQSYFHSVCIGPGSCFGGIGNLAGPDLVETAIGLNGNRVQYALSAAIGTVAGVPGVDQGLDNVAGTAMFSLTFIARESAEIGFGTGYLGDGVGLGDGSQIKLPPTLLRLNVVPEPGTALLLGLGLVGLSATGRRP